MITQLSTSTMRLKLFAPYYLAPSTGSSLSTKSWSSSSGTTATKSSPPLRGLSFARLVPSDVVVTTASAWQRRQQLRFHRTDYGGPGKYNDRETGANFGNAHDHEHNNSHKVVDEEKQRLQKLLHARYDRRSGTYEDRGYTIGIGGPVGSGKTALTLALCRALRHKVQMGVVTNDIFTQEDGEFLVRNEALSKSRIMPVETGGCPHAAIREDVSANLSALETITRRIFAEETSGAAKPLLLCESGGDNLAANFSNELADYTIYVIDVAGGDKVPRKGGPGITQSDLLVINKIDLAEAVGSSLEVMEHDANRMRGGMAGGEVGPTVFASVKNGVGLDLIIGHIMKGFENAHRLVECSK